MESNSDKQLREKLKGFEAPFDPEAWGQMEAMLDEKKKRRGFFWWWFGGIAAGLLLFGVLGYEFGKQAGKGELAVSETTTPAINDSKPGATTNGENTTTPGRQEHTTTEASQQSSSVNETHQVASNSAAGKGGNKHGSVESSTSGKQKSGSGNGKQLYKKAQQTPSANRESVSKRDKQNATQLSAGEEQGNPQAVSNSAVNTNRVAENEGADTLATTEIKAELRAEVEAMNLMWADKLGKEEDKLNDEKKEEISLPKKKKIFRYSVGVMGGMYATTPGWKYYNENETSLITVSEEKAARPAIYKTPSWMVGLTHDFTFVNRFAFTNGLLYSQTSFKLYAPYAQQFNFAPDDYTCNISELAIPTGIKIYPVETPKFRLYVSAGFVHHVKLKESFSYTYTPPPTSNIGTAFDSNSNYFPVVTDFTGGGSLVVKANQLGITEEVRTNTTDFSVAQAKRYYTSFYAGLGVEGIIKKHWILFAEPTYSMTLQRIGYQERRKFSFGGNMGFRYQF